jgi:general secretion pathway protein G
MRFEANKRQSRSGFTLIELLVVMAILATLLTIGVPRYFASVERSKEAVLKENLRVIRDAIDKYYADNGRYPESVEILASRRYLRALPVDPITESGATWITIAPPDGPAQPGVYDIRSGARGNASDGTSFGQW